MSESQHTPGPWHVETVKTSIGHAHKILPPHACLYVDHRGINEKDAKTIEAAANAQLIASAPELLNAAKKFLEFYQDLVTSNPGLIGKCALQDYQRWNEALIELPAAIAKAKG